MIELPEQPVAERILRRALGRPNPPQQLLLFGPPGTGKRRVARQIAWALIDPDGTHDPDAPSLDLSVVTPTGASIRLEAELEPALADLAAMPSVGKRRVLIINSAERLREQEGAPRILKNLEEPSPRSHVILVTDHPADLISTIRSRCLPVPFRNPGWQTIAAELERRGMSAEQAVGLARADGPFALTSGPFERRMRTLGVEMAMAALAGTATPALLVRDMQEKMAAAADGQPSKELERLAAEAEALAGKRGERTAVKRVEDQRKRERRRALTDGWMHVLDGASGLVADALAVAAGAEDAARHRHLTDELRVVGVPSRMPFLEDTLEVIQDTRSEMELNPTLDLAVEAMLARISAARHGEHPRRPRGRLPY